MTWKHILKTGIELEGGWTTPPPSTIGFDGSVSIEAPHRGEVRSQPMDSWDLVEEWILANHPNYTNETCGLHVHVSLIHPSDYARLMDKEFFDFFLDRMAQWGTLANVQNEHFWSRLKGKKSHCARKWDADLQTIQAGKSGPRYTTWNFCLRLHGTAECRVLPVFKSPKISVLAVKQVLLAVEDWLAGGPVAIELEECVLDEEAPCA